MASGEVNMSEKCEFCQEVEKASSISGTQERSKLTNTGVLILGVSGVFFFGIYALTAPFILPALRRICLPFVPATPAQVENVFSALAGRTGSFIDIGSGDGRIVRIGCASQEYCLPRNVYNLILNVLFLLINEKVCRQVLNSETRKHLHNYVVLQTF